MDWRSSRPRADRVRIREHTCACVYPVYELCTAAGLSFVRRTDDEKGEHVVESHWTSANAARVLWMKIVTGQAG